MRSNLETSVDRPTTARTTRGTPIMAALLLLNLFAFTCDAFSLHPEKRSSMNHKHQQHKTALAASLNSDSFETMSRVLQEGSSSSSIAAADGIAAQDTFSPFASAAFDSGGSSSLLTAASTTAASLKPATGHSQPLWGPRDPYLSAGKSIVPPSSSLVPSPPMDYSEKVQAAVGKGWKVLDASTLTGEKLLPGFKHTGGILSPSIIPPETPFSFAGQTEYAASVLPVYQKLPYAVLWYGLVEFFLLRPGIDMYLEDIQEGDVLAETIVTTGVRVAALAVIGVVTFFLFG